jgi:phosphotriesterase-related protein
VDVELVQRRTMKQKKDVVTVLGTVAPQELGVTLMHEHLLINLLPELRLEGLLNDVPLAIQELTRFRKAGGRTIVDVTNASLGRDPEALRVISDKAGINVVIGCGLYRHQYYDSEWVDRMSTNSLADWIVRELIEGIDGTRIRAGIIGEIACDEWITAQEERVFRAAARAHQQTGVTISTHAARWPVGLAQLDLLAEEGVDPHRVIIGHCDTVASVKWTSVNQVTDYHEALARRGAYVQFDTIRRTSDHDLDVRVRYVTNLLDKGYGSQILLSHDVCFRSALRAYGGGGYDFIFTDFIPRLQEARVTQEQINMLLIANPRRALTGEDAFC